jgi:membrane protein required for colicin V production
VNFIDVLIVVPLIYAGYKGFKNGLIIEVFTMLALFVGLYAGVHLSDFIAGFFRKNLGWESDYLPIIAFTLVFLGVGAMVYFAGKAIEKVVKVVQLSTLNKFLGTFFSTLKMLYFVSVVIVIVDAYDQKGHFFPEEKKDSSFLYKPVRNVSTYSVPGLEESTIFIENAFGDESQSTGLSPEEVLRAKEVADSLGLEANNPDEIRSIHLKYCSEQ